MIGNATLYVSNNIFPNGPISFLYFCKIKRPSRSCSDFHISFSYSSDFFAICIRHMIATPKFAPKITPAINAIQSPPIIGCPIYCPLITCSGVLVPETTASASPLEISFQSPSVPTLPGIQVFCPWKMLM